MKFPANIHKTYNYLIRLTIIGATYGFIYWQVFHKRDIGSVYDNLSELSSTSQFRIQFILVLILMVINWGIESLKWKWLIAKIERIGFFKSFEGVLTGVSVSMFTPNRTGDYLGRVFILEKANRIEGALITIVGSISQILVTISVGLFCFLSFFYDYLYSPASLNEYLYTGIVILVPFVVFALVVLYFNIPAFSSFLQKNKGARLRRFNRYFSVFSWYGTRDLLAVLLASLLRYMVFSTQFYLLLKMFSVDVPLIEGLVLISVIYLIMAVVPSIAFADLGIRGSVTLYIIGLYYSHNSATVAVPDLGIITATSLLWLINLVIPALMGTFFVFRLRFFRK